MGKARWKLGAADLAEVVAVVSALVLAIVPLPSGWIEARYSTWIYPFLQRTITPMSNRLPFAVLDVLLVGAGLIVALTLTHVIRRAWRARSLRPVGRPLAHLVSFAAVFYLLFLALWGLNYRRVPMTDRLVLDRPVPSSADVLELGLEAVRKMNQAYDAAHAEPLTATWTNPSLRRAFVQAQHALSDAAPAAPGRLKRTLLGPYFRWTGVDGMVNPFGLEVLANPDLLPFERPFVAAHEWGHLAGYASEAEANFIGWITCLRADPAAQYSGWFYLYWQISGEVAASDRGRLNAALEDGPRRDITAVIARLRRGQVPALQEASWKVYDQYLKANRVEAGVRSYGEVVTLILRARFAEPWTPVRRVAGPSRAP